MFIYIYGRFPPNKHLQKVNSTSCSSYTYEEKTNVLNNCFEVFCSKIEKL